MQLITINKWYSVLLNTLKKTYYKVFGLKCIKVKEKAKSVKKMITMKH